MPSFIAVARLFLSEPMNFSAHPRRSRRVVCQLEWYPRRAAACLECLNLHAAWRWWLPNESDRIPHGPRIEQWLRQDSTKQLAPIRDALKMSPPPPPPLGSIFSQTCMSTDLWRVWGGGGCVSSPQIQLIAKPRIITKREHEEKRNTHSEIRCKIHLNNKEQIQYRQFRINNISAHNKN